MATKLSALDGREITEAVSADFEAAQVFEKVRVGALGAYFKSGLRMKYIPYDYVDKAFIRIHEMDGKCCCGSTKFQYFSLVFVKDGKEIIETLSEDEKSMDEALAAIAKSAPSLKIGVDA